MTAHERFVFTFIQRDSWKRRSNVDLPLKINYLSHIYLQLLFLEYVMILNYAARLPYKFPDPLFRRTLQVSYISPRAVLWHSRLVTIVSRGPGSVPGRYVWDLCWTEWHWNGCLSEYLGIRRQCHSSSYGTWIPIRRFSREGKKVRSFSDKTDWGL